MTREDMTEVVLYTTRYVVTGSIALLPGSRLTDYLRESKNFIAVCDAVVSDHAGKELFRSAFVDVHRDTVEIAIPRDLYQPL